MLVPFYLVLFAFSVDSILIPNKGPLYKRSTDPVTAMNSDHKDQSMDSVTIDSSRNSKRHSSVPPLLQDHSMHCFDCWSPLIARIWSGTKETTQESTTGSTFKVSFNNEYTE